MLIVKLSIIIIHFVEQFFSVRCSGGPDKSDGTDLQIQLVTVWCSIRSILFFNEMPPGALKPPILPSLRMTRWQGIIKGTGFLANTPPMALAAFGEPALAANWP
jgi:hypothetical protein